VHNPVRDVTLPPNNRPRDRRLISSQDPAEDEESRLFAACRKCRNPFLLPIVRLALETAMRQGELLALKWQFINLKQCTAYLPETKNGHSTLKVSGKPGAIHLFNSEHDDEAPNAQWVLRLPNTNTRHPTPDWNGVIQPSHLLVVKPVYTLISAVYLIYELYHHAIHHLVQRQVAAKIYRIELI